MFWKGWLFATNNEETTSKGVTMDRNGNILKCLFCDIIAGKEPASIVYENDEFISFHTIKPYTSCHLLVSPKAHVKSLNQLHGEKDAMMIQRMVGAGQQALEKIKPGFSYKAKFCFHVPPFNSIDHLHLHAISQPETMGVIGTIKYSEGLYCWNAEYAIEQIRRAH
jgi:diadenosine tetraphosphate (Ap4A) HIT family hydrolase